MRREAGLLVGGLLAAFLLAEGVLWVLDRPSTGPFLQVFYGPGLELMAYGPGGSSRVDVDLRDPVRWAHYAARLANEEFEAHWAETPLAVEIRKNSHGYRDVELRPRREGVRRIVLLGDSFSYGHGLTETESLPRQLETMLRERRPQEPVEVLNLGTGGDNLDRIARRAFNALDQLDPDVLVYAYFLNDPDWGDRVDDGGAHAMLDAGWRHRERTKLRFAIGARPVRGSRLWALLSRARESQRSSDATLQWYRALHEPEYWAASGELIETIDRRARSAGRRFVLVVLPLPWRLDGGYPLADLHARVTDFARSRGIEVIDGLEVLRGRPDAELVVHPRDRHPSAEYSRLIAQRLARALGSEAATVRSPGPSRGPAAAAR